MLMSDRATRQDRLRDAVKWKMMLGVPKSRIDEAHGYDVEMPRFYESMGFTGRGVEEESDAE